MIETLLPCKRDIPYFAESFRRLPLYDISIVISESYCTHLIIMSPFSPFLFRSIVLPENFGSVHLTVTSSRYVSYRGKVLWKIDMILGTLSYQLRVGVIRELLIRK